LTALLRYRCQQLGGCYTAPWNALSARFPGLSSWTPLRPLAPFLKDIPKNVIALHRYVPDKLREHLQVINGIRVYGTGGNWYDVPSLGIAMAIQGPLGGRVLHTLTRSPQARLSVVVPSLARLRRLNSSIVTPHRCELGELWIKSGFRGVM
jgi:hypothetical protein